MHPRLALAVGIVIAAAEARATAPCFDVCHLGQGQPLLVAGEIWVRPCATVKGATTCVVQRRDVEGRVRATLPGDAVYDEDEFETKHLKGKAAVRLTYTDAWTDLRKPYKPHLETATMTMRLDRTTLLCEAGGRVVRRPLGCRPRALSVRIAGIDQSSKAEDPTGIAVVIAECAKGKDTRDVIVVCQAKPPRP